MYPKICKDIICILDEKKDEKSSSKNKSDSTNETKSTITDNNASSNTTLNSKSDQSGETNLTQLVAKEHFVFTDPEGQLYHFSVEGNTIRDGTKVITIKACSSFPKRKYLRFRNYFSISIC